jgi:polysaccharide biosynthesis transport protein
LALGNVARILWARKWIGVGTAVSSVVAAYGVASILPPRYEAVATVTLDVSEPDPVTGNAMGGPSARQYQRTLVTMLKSDRVALDVVDRLNLTRARGYIEAFNEDTGGKGDLARWIAHSLDDYLKADLPESGQTGNMMTVSYRSPDPRFAQQVTNAFVAAFVKATLELKVTPAQQNAQWYEGELTNLRKGLEEAQARYAAYQQEVGLLGKLDKLDRFDAETDTLHALADRLSQVRAELTGIESAVAQLQVAWPDIATLPPRAQIPSMLTSATIEKLKADLTNTEADIAKAVGEVGSGHPRLIALRATLAAQQQLLRNELLAARSALLARVDATRIQLKSTEAAYSEQQAKILGLQHDKDKLAALAKDVALKQDLLDGASAKASSLRLQGQASFVNATVIDEAAVPDKPVFPKMILIIPISLAAGLALGLALSMLAEMLDRRVRSPADLEHAAGAKSLGVLMSRRQRSRRRHLATSLVSFVSSSALRSERVAS